MKKKKLYEKDWLVAKKAVKNWRDSWKVNIIGTHKHNDPITRELCEESASPSVAIAMSRNEIAFDRKDLTYSDINLYQDTLNDYFKEFVHIPMTQIQGYFELLRDKEGRDTLLRWINWEINRCKQ